MSNSKDNISNKSVTHTDHRSKTKSNSFSNDVKDYKYSPNVESPNPKATADK